MVRNRNWSSVTWVSSGAPFSFQSGISSLSADGIDDRARQDVRADLRALLEQADGDLVAALGGELLQADRRREPGRAAADDHHVVFHRLARHSRLALQCLFNMDAPPAGDDPSIVDSLLGGKSPPSRKGEFPWQS